MEEYNENVFINLGKLLVSEEYINGTKISNETKISNDTKIYIDDLHNQKTNLEKRKMVLLEEYNKLVTQQHHFENKFSYLEKKIIKNKYYNNSLTNFSTFYNQRIIRQLNEIGDAHKKNATYMEQWKTEILSLDNAISNVNYFILQFTV
jgi:peptidoglycan hydrolase CwlO-like protein